MYSIWAYTGAGRLSVFYVNWHSMGNVNQQNSFSFVYQSATQCYRSYLVYYLYIQSLGENDQVITQNGGACLIPLVQIENIFQHCKTTVTAVKKSHVTIKLVVRCLICLRVVYVHCGFELLSILSLSCSLSVSQMLSSQDPLPGLVTGSRAGVKLSSYK